MNRHQKGMGQLVQQLLNRAIWGVWDKKEHFVLATMHPLLFLIYIRGSLTCKNSGTLTNHSTHYGPLSCFLYYNLTTPQSTGYRLYTSLGCTWDLWIQEWSLMVQLQIKYVFILFVLPCGNHDIRHIRFLASSFNPHASLLKMDLS